MMNKTGSFLLLMIPLSLYLSAQDYVGVVADMKGEISLDKEKTELIQIGDALEADTTLYGEYGDYLEVVTNSSIKTVSTFPYTFTGPVLSPSELENYTTLCGEVVLRTDESFISFGTVSEELIKDGFAIEFKMGSEWKISNKSLILPVESEAEIISIDYVIGEKDIFSREIDEVMLNGSISPKDDSWIFDFPEYTVVGGGRIFDTAVIFLITTSDRKMIKYKMTFRIRKKSETIPVYEEVLSIDPEGKNDFSLAMEQAAKFIEKGYHIEAVRWMYLHGIDYFRPLERF